MQSPMKKKIVEIREKYHWQSLFKIIGNKDAEKKDRMFMILMCFWFIPTYVFLKIAWILLGILLFIPNKLFEKIDDLLY